MNYVKELENLYQSALRINDMPLAESIYVQLAREKEYMGHNPMEESEEEMDAGAMSVYSGLDPVQIEYARLKGEAMANAQMNLNKMWVTSTPTPPMNLGIHPGSLVSGTSAGSNVVFTQTLKPMAIFKEPSQADKDFDKRRHLKLFVHFAKHFADRYPTWTVVPDPADPLHSVHLLQKTSGAMIHNLYPMNEMAVYGGPASWTDPRKELGQPLPIVKINTQEFWGWCVGMDDVPEWMMA